MPINPRDLPEDLRIPLMRFVEAAQAARIELTSFDLNLVLPAREFSTKEVEVMFAFLDEHGIHIREDPDEC